MNLNTEVLEEINYRRNRFFNQGLAGKHQRSLVHSYLSRQNYQGFCALEMNCGMGDDFPYFVKNQIQVEASDISRKMVHFCRNRIKTEEMPGIKVNVAGFHQLHLLYPEHKFDLAFSNFAGINCIDNVEISMLSRRLGHLLKDKGQLILVVKGRFSFFESICLIINGHWNKVFRRLSRSSKPASVKVISHPIWFYSPREIKRLFSQDFKLKKIEGIGLFIPPPCMNDKYEKRKFFSRIALALDKLICRFTWAAYVSDHFLIHLEKRETLV